ncbi:9045_t:CDS:10, partial [Ambispora leptoticha]
YPDGFQIWDITNLDDVHELTSIRDDENFGEVSYLKVIPNPRNISKDPKDSSYENSFPLVALICKQAKSIPQENNEFPDALARPRSVLKFVSLKSHEVVKEMSFENEGTVTSIKCNERAIVVALSNPSRLHVLNTLTLENLLPTPLTDVASHPITRAPIFSLGPRLLAYATTSQPSERSGKSDGDYLLGEADEKNGGTGRYQEVAKDVAKGVAKEVVNGVKLLGDYGYQTISAYFSNGFNPQNPSASSSFSTSNPINIKSGANSRSPYTPQHSPNHHLYYNPKGSVGSASGDTNGLSNGIGNVDEVIGAIMIRDIGTQNTKPGTQKLPPVVAHFQPHTHPVGYLSFNPSGTLLFSTSVQGHKFHIFEILGKRRRGGGQKTIKHIYRLARGLTDASVGEGSVGWSVDSRWCAVASGRGTIHVFAINPYGGPADVPSHIKGCVINSEEPYVSSTQSPVVRIKPRNPLPLDPTDPANFPSQSSNQLFPNLFANAANDYSVFQFESNSSSAAASPMRRPSSLHPNGSSTSLYIHNQQIPYNGALITTNNNIPISGLLRKPPGICLKFLPSLSVDPKSGANFIGNLQINSQRNAKRRSSPATSNSMTPNNPLSGHSARRERRRTKSWTQNSNPATALSYSNFEEEDEDGKFDNIGYQDILSFHPTGILTLHRVWMEGVLIGGDNESFGKEEGITGSAAAVANMGRVLVGGAAGVVGMGMEFAGVGRKDAVRPGEPTLGLLVEYEDLLEWNLFRGQNWAEVKSPNLSKDQEITVKKDNSKKWLAHAEIATHTTSRTSLPPPLWLSHQFSFHTYIIGSKESTEKGIVPETKKLEIKRKIIIEEDDECKNGWVKNGKVATFVEDGRIVRGLEDISEHISSAMNTDLEVKSNELLETIIPIPLSFENAYHVPDVPTLDITTTAASSQPPPSHLQATTMHIPIPPLLHLLTFNRLSPVQVLHVRLELRHRQLHSVII